MASGLAKGEFEEALQLFLRERLADAPEALADPIRYILLSRGKLLRPRLAIAAAKMMSVKREAALAAAIALETIHCASLLHEDLPCLGNAEARRGQPATHRKYGEALALLTADALLPLAFEVFLDASSRVEAENFARALRRLVSCAGPAGIPGGQAERLQLTSESSLDDLKRVNTRRGALFAAAILIPKDFAGIADDSSQGLALEIFARELGLAYQTLHDFRNPPGEAPLPSHILFYLPPKEARSMTLQRLNSATLSLSSSWGPESQPLVQIAEEITREIQAAPES